MLISSIDVNLVALVRTCEVSSRVWRRWRVSSRWLALVHAVR